MLAIHWGKNKFVLTSHVRRDDFDNRQVNGQLDRSIRTSLDLLANHDRIGYSIRRSTS